MNNKILYFRSVGCVVLEMLNGYPPWSNLTKDVKEVLKLIVSGSTFNNFKLSCD